MKPIKTAVCALALMLGCVPLTACGNRSDDTAKKAEEEQEVIAPLPEEQAPSPLPEEEQEVVVPLPEGPKAEEPKAEEPARAQYILVGVNGLNVRTGAGTAYASLGAAEKGVLLDYVSKEGGWYETRYLGRKAFVSADTRYTSLTRLDTGSEKIERVIAEGLTVLGTPYVYGAVRLHDGKGNLLKNFKASEFDCSSLMQYMFYRGAGVLLNMTTRTQVTQGKEVAKANLRRGDLLFFTNASRKNLTGIERVGHVALYLGDNYILHTASDYAKIEQISATRWGYFLTARRMI